MAIGSRLVVARTFIAALRAATKPGAPGLGDRASAVPRMVRATLSGRYPGMTKARLALLFAAAAYIVSPVDLFPEALLSVVGLADDAVVLSWLAAALVADTETFLAWEASGGGPVVPSTTVTPEAGSAPSAPLPPRVLPPGTSR